MESFNFEDHIKEIMGEKKKIKQLHDDLLDISSKAKALAERCGKILGEK